MGTGTLVLCEVGFATLTRPIPSSSVRPSYWRSGQSGTYCASRRSHTMVDHTGIVVSDLARARRFYDAIAEALGLETASNSAESFLFGRSAEEPIPYL